VVGRRVACDLLRRDVVRRAEGLALGPVGFGDVAGQAHVGEFDEPLAGEHDVAGLDVAVDEVAVVCGPQALGHLADDRHRLGRVEPLADLQQVGQRPAIDVLHDDGHGVGERPDLVNRHDVRMRQDRRSAGLPQEPLAGLRLAGRSRMQHLDRHHPVHLHLPAPVDDRLGPPADAAQHFQAGGLRGDEFGRVAGVGVGPGLAPPGHSPASPGRRLALVERRRLAVGLGCRGPGPDEDLGERDLAAGVVGLGQEAACGPDLLVG